MNARTTPADEPAPLPRSADTTVVPRMAQKVRIRIGAETREFAFQPDEDLTKLVSVTPAPGALRIIVRYVTDAVVQQDEHLLAIRGGAKMSVDGHGLIVTWREPLIPGLDWLTMERKRRF